MHISFEVRFSKALARRILGGLLIVFGTIGVAWAIYAFLSAASGLRHWEQGSRVLAILGNSLVPVVLGLLVILRRWRGVGVLLSSFGLLQLFFLWLTADYLLPWLMDGPSRTGSDAALIYSYTLIVVALVYFYTLIVLLWPEYPGRFTSSAAKPAEEPTNSNWREWLLGSLRDASVERTPDRFIEIVLLSLALFPPIALLRLAHVRTIQFAGTDSWWMVPILWTVVSLLIFWPIVLRGIRLVRQLRARGAEDEILRPGSRRPILYLRSFEIDEPSTERRLSLLERLFWYARPRAEESLAEELRRCGPLIAIGRPGEYVPELGAARFYVSDDKWREKIADAVRVSQLVVLTTGTSEGLAWELSHVIAHLAPEKLVLRAHPNLMRLDRDGREAEWTRFLAALGSLFPKPLPDRLGETRFLEFGPGFEPIPVEPRTTWRTLLNRQLRHCRGLLAAKDLPRPDPVLRARRRRILRLAAASAAATVLVTGGVIGLAEWTAAEVRRKDLARRRAVQSVARVLVSNEEVGAPDWVLEEHRKVLSWDIEKWRQHPNVVEFHDSVRSILEQYVRLFELAHQEPSVEGLLYASGLPLLFDMRDAADASKRLDVLTSISDALRGLHEDYLFVRVGVEFPFPMSDPLAHRIDRRASLLVSEGKILQFLTDNLGSWTIESEDDGTVPVFSDPALQDELVTLVDKRHEQFKELYEVLARPLADDDWPDLTPPRSGPGELR